MNTFKENWEKVDELCPCCNQVTKRQKGITRQSIKRLFSFKFNMNEMITLFMLIMIIALAFAYKSETAQSREWISSMTSGGVENCLFVCNAKCQLLEQREIQEGGLPNFSLTITNDTMTLTK